MSGARAKWAVRWASPRCMYRAWNARRWRSSGPRWAANSPCRLEARSMQTEPQGHPRRGMAFIHGAVSNDGEGEAPAEPVGPAEASAQRRHSRTAGSANITTFGFAVLIGEWGAAPLPPH